MRTHTVRTCLQAKAATRFVQGLGGGTSEPSRLVGRGGRTGGTTRLDLRDGNAEARRGLAKAAKGKKAAGETGNAAGAKDGPKVDGDGGLGVIPVNFMRDGSHPPVKPDSEYPSWLWDLKLPSLPVLQRKEVDDLTLPELRRLVQLKNREGIKESNADPSF